MPNTISLYTPTLSILEIVPNEPERSIKSTKSAKLAIDHLIKPASTKDDSKKQHVSTIQWLKSSWPVAKISLIVARCLLKSKSPMNKLKVDRQIDELSGSQRMSQAIHAATPSIALGLQEHFSTLPSHQGLNNYLKGEQSILHQMIDELIPEMYINIAKHIRTTEGNRQHNKSVGLVDVVSWFLNILESHLPKINADYERLNQIEDPERRSRKLCALFLPLTESVLSVALPHGIKDLPLRSMPFLSERLWKSTQEQYLPLLFLDFYQQLTGSRNDNKKDLLKKMPGGEVLISLSELSAKKTGEGFPKLFSVENKEIVQAIQDFFGSFFTGSTEEGEEYSQWLVDQLIELSRSNFPNIVRFRMYIGSFIEPLLIHMFFRLSEKPSTDGIEDPHCDVRSNILMKLFMISSSFFNEKGKIIEQHIQDSLNHGEDLQENDPTLLRIFKGFTDELLAAMGLDYAADLPVPTFLKSTIFKQIEKFSLEIVLKEYLAVKKSSIQDQPLRWKLRELLFDPKNIQKPDIAVKVLTSLFAKGNEAKLNMYTEFYQRIWKESGTERIVDIIETMSRTIVKDLISSMMDTGRVSYHPLLNESNNPVMTQARNYLEALVGVMLLEITVSVIEKSSQPLSNQDRHPQQLLPLEIILRFLGITQHRLKDIDKKTNETGESQETIFHEQERQRLLFSSLVDSLYTLGIEKIFSHLPLEGLPGAENIRQLISESVKDIALPDLINNLYSSFHVWTKQIDDSHAALDNCYHTTHLSWAMRVIAQYGSDWIRNFLSNSSEEAAEPLISYLIEFCKKPEHTDTEWIARLLADPLCDANAFVSENIKAFGLKESKETLNLWPAITTHIEAILTKFFASITNSIQEIETENPDFMKDLAITMLKDIQDYLDSTTKIKSKQGASGTENIDHEEAILLDSKVSIKEKNAIRLKKYFLPLSSKLFDLARIAPEDFPVPEQLKKPVAQWVIEQLIPNILLQMYSVMLENPVRDSVTLSFLEALHNALNEVKPIGKVQEDVEPKEIPDPKQVELKEECSVVVSQFVGLITDPLVQYVFSKDKVKNISAEVISKAMNKYLSKWTLVQLIDHAVFTGLPKLHPATWKGKTGRESLIPLEDFIRADGKVVRQVGKKFSFHFPKTAAEVQAQKILKMQEAAETRKFLRNGFTMVISSEAMTNTGVFIKSLWESFQSHIDDFIKMRFPENGPRIKEMLDRIFRKVFIDLIGTAIQFIFYPLTKFFQYLLEKIYVDRKSDDIIENVHTDDLEMLVHKLTSTIMSALLGSRVKLSAF